MEAPAEKHHGFKRELREEPRIVSDQATQRIESAKAWPRMIGWLAKTKDYEQVEVDLDEESQILWCYMSPKGRPSVTPGLANEARQLQEGIRHCYQRGDASSIPFKYMVWGSSVPGVFNLGGDLKLFAQLIREGRRGDLLAYATNCVDVVYANAVNLELPVITISLIQGDALGGGFEAAISGNVVIAEKSAKFGLPEVLFNLFPGMGAYSLISRRIGPAQAERMIFSGKVYSAEELYELGLVDMIVEDGTGQTAVMDYVSRNVRRHNANIAVYRARQRINPLSYEELYEITVDWVDAALTLTDSDLRRMERLAGAQDKRRLGR